MSGRASGWVGEHGPHPDDIDKDGQRYELRRARPLRAVLLAVADAANADGQHSHPGVARIASFTLYSEGQVRRLLGQLVDDGWLEVDTKAPAPTSRGRGGRGVATTYNLVMVDNRHVAARVRDARVSTDETRAGDIAKPAQETPETRAGEPKPAHEDARPTVSTTTTPTVETNAADAVARAIWEARDPKPATPFVGLRKIVEKLLAGGWTPAEVTVAGAAVPTLSTGWLEAELARRRRPNGRAAAPVVDRSAPSGRLYL